MEWEKAARRDRLRAAGHPPKHADAKRQKAIGKFVSEHKLACFVCGGDRAEWAKSGISKRGPWVICVPCVKASSSPAAQPHR